MTTESETPLMDAKAFVYYDEFIRGTRKVVALEDAQAIERLLRRAEALFLEQCDSHLAAVERIKELEERLAKNAEFYRAQTMNGQETHKFYYDKWQEKCVEVGELEERLVRISLGLNESLASERAARLEAEQALAAIVNLDPSNTDEGYNEWGEAFCFRSAQDIARAALSQSASTEQGEKT